MYEIRESENLCPSFILQGYVISRHQRTRNEVVLRLHFWAVKDNYSDFISNVPMNKVMMRRRLLQEKKSTGSIQTPKVDHIRGFIAGTSSMWFRWGGRIMSNSEHYVD